MATPDRACPDYPNECVHPWAHARTYAEVRAAEELKGSPTITPDSRPDVKAGTPLETQHITATCRSNKGVYVAWENAVHLLRHVYEAQLHRDPNATISVAIYRTSDPGGPAGTR
jgi:hypothetical protein